MSAPALSLLTASPLFGDLPPAELAALAALAHEQRFASPTLLVARGERSDRLWHVLEGSVEIGLFSASGRAGRLAPILPGGWATWLACFQDAPLPHDLWTGPSTRLLSFPTEAVRALAVRQPQIYPRLINRIGERMRDLIGWSLAASLGDPEQRLAYLLVAAGRDRVAGDAIDLALTQEGLSAMGMGTRQRVARLLRALARRGLIEQRYGMLHIPSLQRLEAFAAP